MSKTYETAHVCEDFITQYKAIKPRSAADYNKNRTKGSPQWVAIARMCGLSKWYDLLDYCGLERPQRIYPTGRKEPKREIVVHRYSDYEEYMKYLDSQEYWDLLGERLGHRSRTTFLSSTR